MATNFVIPEIAGTNITFVGEETVRPLASVSDVVAIGFAHDWGPINEVTEAPNFSEWEAVYGNSNTDGRDGVLGAFVGSGVPGEAGAGSVLSVRMATASAAKATLTIQNTTPAAALTITALYQGTRGNRIKIAVENDPANPATQRRLRVLLDDVTVERYVYLTSDVAGLATQINSRPSKYITATSLITGVALATSAGTTLASGADGTPLTIAEYDAAMDKLEFKRFSILAFSNLTDATIQAAVLAWVENMALAMRPVEAVFGSGSGVTLDQAKTAVALLRSEHLSYLAAGTLQDDYLDKQISFAKFAPRYAGILAGRGEDRSPLFAPLNGIALVGNVEVTSDRIKEAEQAGLTVLQMTTTAVSDVVVQNAVTTFTSTATLAKPYKIFRDPRMVRVMDLFIRRVKEKGDTTLIGLPNSDSTRAAAKVLGEEELNSMIGRGLIRNDAAVAPPFFNVLPLDPSNEDAIFFEFGWAFAYTTRYVVGVGRIR